MELFFGGNAGWFSAAAIVGTGFFLFRLIMMTMVGDVDGHHDVDFAGDAGDAGHGDADGGDSDDAFKVLSLQGISAFLMGFGWGGLGGYRGSGWSFTSSFAFGIVLGSAMVWVLGRVLEWVYRLQSHGNVSIHDTIGLEGSVYAQVPGSGVGKGQVRLIVGERERFFNAITDGDALETRTRVRVVDVNDDNTITVAAADAEE